MPATQPWRVTVTQTEQLMIELRSAIRAELVAELRAYRDSLDPDEQSDGYLDGIEDAACHLEQA